MSFLDKSVACIKNVDWTKEISSYHIKWNVGVITDDDLGRRKKSPSFHIGTKGTHLFNLSMWIPPKEDEKGDLNVNVGNVDFPVPIIHRFALSYKDQEIHMTDSQVEVKQHFYFMAVDIDGSLLKRDAHLVVHCWLDIPTAIIKKIEDQSMFRFVDVPQVPWNVRNFQKNCEQMYKSAVGEKQESALSDVKLVLVKESNRQFNCHRIILAGASPMFDTMFATNQWKEGKDGSVDIDDIDEDTMKAVLYHIYTGKFKEVESENLKNLIYAGDKYQLKDLKAWAEIQTMMICTDSERIDCLVFAERHQLHQLQAVCIIMLSTNIQLLTSDEFKEKLSKEVKEEITKMGMKRQLSTTHISIGK